MFYGEIKKIINTCRLKKTTTRTTANKKPKKTKKKNKSKTNNILGLWDCVDRSSCAYIHSLFINGHFSV